MHDHVPRDTDPEAHRVQMEILRGFSVDRRAQMAIRMSGAAMTRARDVLRQRHPDENDEQIMLRLVELNYGADLAHRVRERLAAR